MAIFDDLLAKFSSKKKSGGTDLSTLLTGLDSIMRQKRGTILGTDAGDLFNVNTKTVDNLNANKMVPDFDRNTLEGNVWGGQKSSRTMENPFFSPVTSTKMRNPGENIPMNNFTNVSAFGFSAGFDDEKDRRMGGFGGRFFK
jgi:hypothetical protein